MPAGLFSLTTQSPVQLKKIIEKPLEVSNVDSKIIQSNVGFFEPITQDPIYNWIWADVSENENKDFDNYENFNQDDLRDPDMTTIGTGKDKITFMVPKDTKNDKLPLMDCPLNDTFLLTFETLV